MQLRPVDVAGLADGRDRLTARNPVAASYQQGVGVGIGRRPAVRVLDQQQVAETAQLVAGIDDDAVLGGTDLGARRGGAVDSVLVPPALRSEESRVGKTW